MSEAATHLRELAGRIGPRLTTTDLEAEAADYIQSRFEARGLDVERQEFLAPRTHAWAYVSYHIVTIGAAVLAGWYAWPAFLLALLSAVAMTLDLDTRGGLSSLMPKGPSQNVIGRKPPNLRRGESARTVVVVAHYDSARPSLGFHPAMVTRFELSFGLMKAIPWLVTILVFVDALGPGFIESAQPWWWYLTLLAAAYLLFPIVIFVHSELFLSPNDGANDNASGVAAMLGVLERAISEEVVAADTRTMPAVTELEPVIHGAEAVEEAELVPEGATLTYSPATVPEEAELDIGASDSETADDLEWEEVVAPIEGQGELELTEETEDVGAAVYDRGPMPVTAVLDEEEQEVDEDVVEADEPEDFQPKQRRRWFRSRRKETVGDWLGLESDFNAVEEGRKIGSWDQFEDTAGESDEGERGEKGGMGGQGAVDDPGFASAEAARIRHLVTHGSDRALDEKEIWFVATGAEETGTWGMRAFLKQHGEELKRAAFINVDNVGGGAVSWVTREGMVRRYPSDRRLVGAAKRVVRELDLRVKGRVYRGLSTDATPALARGYRAMSVMGFDVNGRIPHWHWKTDVVENVSVDNVEAAADLVAEIIREL